MKLARVCKVLITVLGTHLSTVRIIIKAIILFHMLFCPFLIIYSPAILPLGLLPRHGFSFKSWKLCFSLMWKLTEESPHLSKSVSVVSHLGKKPVSQMKKK